MKKAVVIALLGLVSVATAAAQGHVAIWSYSVPPYNPIVWGFGGPGGRVNLPSIQLQIWYAAGVVTDEDQLVPGVTFTVNPELTFHGGGYYDAVIQVLPTVGTYTFQLRANGDTPWGYIPVGWGRSILWQPTGIGPTSDPAYVDTLTPTLVIAIPEPRIALLGLGSAALMIARRRG